MKFFAVSLAIAVAVVATVALAPVSSWVFMNQVDLLTGIKSNEDGVNQGGVVDSYSPTWLLSRDTYAGADRAQRLVHALLGKYPERNADLLKVAEEYPRDALGWALVVRMTATIGALDPDTPNSMDAAQKRAVYRVLDQGYEASLKGEALEPNNAYFPLMRAAFAKELNRRDDVREAIHDAAGKSTFDSHLGDEGRMYIEALQSAKGYRGELLKSGVVAAVAMPDLSHAKSLAKFLNRHGSMAERRDTIQASYLIAMGEESTIGLLVGSAEMRLAIRNPVPFGLRDQAKLSDAEWTHLASTFDDKLKQAKVKPPSPGTFAIFQDYSRLLAASKKYIASLPALYPTSVDPDDSADAAEIRIARETFVPFYALVSLIFGALSVAMGWGFSQIKSDAARKIVPHFAVLAGCIVTLWQTGDCNGCDPVPIAGLLFGVAHIALASLRLGTRAANIFTTLTAAGAISGSFWHAMFLNPFTLVTCAFIVLVAAASWLLNADQRQALAQWLGIAMAIGGIAIFKWDHSAILGGAAYLVLLGLLAKNNAGETPKFLYVVALFVFVVACGGIGFEAGRNVLDGNAESGYAAACLSGLILAAAFLGKSARMVRTAASVTLVLFSASYLGSVGWQIRGNRELRQSKIFFTDEGDNIRVLAGVKPLH